MTETTDADRGPPDWAESIRAIAENRDRAAFGLLFAQFAPRVKAFLLRSGISDAAAEDLAQEALLAVWRKASLFNPAKSAVSTWIFTIARNLRIDFYRREHRGGGSGNLEEVDMEFVIDEAPGAEQVLFSNQSEGLVRRALATLSQDQKRVLELAYYEDKAHPEIARLLGIPLGTVKSRLRLAVEKLRHQLSELS